MYETYTRYIYEWLTDTFFTEWQTQIESILSKLDSILTIIQNGLYLGTFAFFFWIMFIILRPHLFKI